MTEHSASAPGKVILFGEHAVVYGQPALAVPVRAIRATATVRSAPPSNGLVIEAQDLDLRVSLAEAAAHGLALTARLTLEALGEKEPDAIISVRSDIPLAAGLGSGAAVSAATARALAGFLSHTLSDARLSDLVYQVEKLYHGTPSGIDNTVICYEMPVFFVRGAHPETFRPAVPFDLLIGDTGVPSPTRETVGGVRDRWQADPDVYNARFAAIGHIARQARAAIEAGDVARVGSLMIENQQELRQIGVSSAELEGLIESALAAGADGAKLSGGGGGGNMIALVQPEAVEAVSQALRRAGAVRVLHTLVS
jgi:mevalonate kinase